MVASSSPPPSPLWPTQCKEQYAPVRMIGTGGFGSVWMAKRRDSNATITNGNFDTHVAIKVVGNDTYAQREVEILHALSSKQHPNIVRFLQDFSGDEGQDHFIVLSLARGPKLQYILNKEGALGLKIAQCISKQLISAVSFLHGHAVIHRDISPGNLIVSGGMLQDDMWWSDEFDSDGKLLALTRKCKITLIDFGFAIALTPEDINESIQQEQQGVEKPLGDHNKDQPRGRLPRNLDDSCSRQVLRDLSPLGTRTYAAPEVLSGIRNVIQQHLDSSSRRRQKRRNSSSECTSDYGMVVDAYSVGSTISHMVTGIPPNQDANEFLDAKNHPLKKLACKIKRCIGNGAGAKKNARVKVYRHRNDLPLDVSEVITSLTHFDSRRRCTVRNARNLPWIKEEDVIEEKIPVSVMALPCMKSGSPVTYLRCSRVSAQ